MGKLVSDAATASPLSPVENTNSSTAFSEIFAHQVAQSEKHYLSEKPGTSAPGEAQFLVMAPLEYEKTNNSSDQSQEKGERALGRQVMEHLKDQDWLIDHQKEVRSALDRVWRELGLSEFKSFMTEIEKKSDGNLYLEAGNGLLGSINPLNPPGNQVARVYLTRGLLRPDTLLFDTRQKTSWAP